MIILSLVRNNDINDIGFLYKPERINVAMSRAMDRLIIVGATGMWANRHESPLNKVLVEVEQLVQKDLAAIIPSKTLGEGA